jgi:hypothetical protein
MTKNLVIALVVVLALVAVALAQTAARKPSQPARPNTNAPSKVTGDGVKTQSGLQYWDIKVGTGTVAKEGSKVKVHYTGWLTTGKKFDSPAFRFHDWRGRSHQGMGRGRSGHEDRWKAAVAHPARTRLRRCRISASDSTQCHADLRRAVAGGAVRESNRRTGATKASENLCVLRVLCG